MRHLNFLALSLATLSLFLQNAAAQPSCTPITSLVSLGASGKYASDGETAFLPSYNSTGATEIFAVNQQELQPRLVRSLAAQETLLKATIKGSVATLLLAHATSHHTELDVIDSHNGIFGDADDISVRVDSSTTTLPFLTPGAVDINGSIVAWMFVDNSSASTPTEIRFCDLNGLRAPQCGATFATTGILPHLAPQYSFAIETQPNISFVFTTRNSVPELVKQTVGGQVSVLATVPPNHNFKVEALVQGAILFSDRGWSGSLETTQFHAVIPGSVPVPVSQLYVGLGLEAVQLLTPPSGIPTLVFSMYNFPARTRSVVIQQGIGSNAQTLTQVFPMFMPLDSPIAFFNSGLGAVAWSNQVLQCNL